MTVHHVTRDLFDQDLPALAHGVNCRGWMNAGIAKEFRRRWPAMYKDYRLMCKSRLLEPGALHSWTSPDRVKIFNLATQDRPGRHARLEWVRSSVEAMLVICEREDVEAVGMPRIGAGIGGLNWPDVASALDEVAAQSLVQVVVVSLPETLGG